MSGWFAVKRGITDHAAMKGDFARVGWFLWMIENAAWQDTKIDIGGKPHVVPRGALCFSERFIAAKFGVSQQAVRTFLRDLEAHKVIAQEVISTGAGTKSKRKQVTLCNYEKYQSAPIKTKSKQNQNEIKEEQVNNIPVGTADKSASSDVVDLASPNAVVWAIGRAYLTPFVGSKKAGPIIGKWLKADEPAAVITAIEAAKRAGTQDPVPYITQALKPKHIRERDEQRRVQNAWLGLPADA